MHFKQCLIDRVNEHTFLPNCLNQRGIVIDLGMNRGRFAKIMRDRYGCSVAGLEANPLLAKEVSDLSGILCKNAAIASSDGFVEFLIDKENPEASRIVEPASHLEAITVPSVSLSTLFREFNSGEVDLLKIDVEGAELDLIEKTDPHDLLRCRQITVEFHSFIFPDQGPRIEKSIALLSEIGFSYMDFSMSRTDVLFISNRILELTPADKLFLGFQKYGNGVMRRLGRFGQQVHRPT